MTRFFSALFFALAFCFFVLSAPVLSSDRSDLNHPDKNAAESAPDRELLDLEKAQSMALANHPSLQELEAVIRSSRNREVYIGELPDPDLSLSLVNLPVDSLALDEDPMNQIKVGVRQKIPFPGKLSLKQQKEALGRERYRLKLRDLEARLVKEVRKAWLDVFYQNRALEVIDANLKLFEDLLSVARTQYTVGRGLQQDILLAQLERDRLEDERIRLKNALELAKDKLVELTLAEPDSLSIPDELPDLAELPPLEDILSGLSEHPMILAQKKRIRRRDTFVELARKEYYPDFGVEVSYGHRRARDMEGDRHSDFVSGGVTMELPVFHEDRQDRRVAAAREEKTAARKKLESLMVKLKRRARSAWSDMRHYRRRVDLFQETILPESQNTIEANRSAYISGRLDFLDLVRSRIQDYKYELKLWKLRVESVKSRAELLYLAREGGNE
jgi:outer membrane protein TolC